MLGRETKVDDEKGYTNELKKNIGDSYGYHVIMDLFQEPDLPDVQQPLQYCSLSLILAVHVYSCIVFFEIAVVWFKVAAVLLLFCHNGNYVENQVMTYFMTSFSGTAIYDEEGEFLISRLSGGPGW